MPVTFRPFKRAARYVTVAALCAASTWAHAAATIKVDSLTIGSDLTYPPYAYLDAGKPAGFDADFSRLLAGKLSLQPVFVDTRFPDLILGMRARRFDTVASALYVTPERAKLIDYVPYLKTGSSLLVLANSAYAHGARGVVRQACGLDQGRVLDACCRRSRARPASPRARARSRCWNSRRRRRR